MKHTLKARIRAFRIWQELGYNPWKRQRASRKDGGDFYKGAFDSIPFLNDDAKRTFVHLILRPGYMIRDYINGKHDRYLAPLTALIIFYAFFSLISAVLRPLEPKKTSAEAEETPEEVAEPVQFETNNEVKSKIYEGLALIVDQGYSLLHLDERPEEVDTRAKAALAALEDTLRSKGITLFLGDFFLLWFSMGLCLRKYRVSWSAAAAAAAYVLCQFCFFMLFAVLLSWGERTSAGLVAQAVILMVDYRQWLSLSWRKSIGRTIRTGIFYFLIYFLFFLLLGTAIFVTAWARGVIDLSALSS